MSVRWCDIEVKVDFGLHSEEAIRPHGGKQIHQKIVDAAVPGMDKLGDILEHVIQGFNDAAFAQHYPVVKGHQTLFHV